MLSHQHAAFTGDVLVTNNEICKRRRGFGGMNIYDVTDPRPRRPRGRLRRLHRRAACARRRANEIHSVFAWDAGDKAYAVMVDNEETADVDIVDITDPQASRS